MINMEQETISIILPTRKRADKVKEMLQSIEDTVHHKDRVEVCFYFDEDDTTTHEQCKSYFNDFTFTIKSLVGPRIVMSNTWNKAFEELSTNSIIMLCADDFRFRTENWDDMVYGAFSKYPDKILLVYGNDLIWTNGRLATHGFVHRKWIEITGMWLPPYFVSDYCDTWIDNVARMVNRIQFIPKMIIEHLHFCVGKAQIDENTMDRLKRHSAFQPKITWDATLDERKEQARKLLIYIINYKKQHN